MLAKPLPLQRGKNVPAEAPELESFEANLVDPAFARASGVAATQPNCRRHRRSAWLEIQHE